MPNGTNVGTIYLTLKLAGINSLLKAAEQSGNLVSKVIQTTFKTIGISTVKDFTKVSLDAAKMSQSAWTGLNSIIDGQGRSFQQAEKFIDGYISDGLVPLNNAVGAYKNLALRGYDTSQIEQLMGALKDSASFSRQASYSMGDAIETATEGLKNENSVVVDNARSY